LTNLATVVLSGGSVCLGAALTMLGQYLADRRSHMRDREERREGFRITNFEIQRSALLELQEVVIKTGHSITSMSPSMWDDLIRSEFPERAKLSHWYQVREVRQEWADSLTEGAKLLAEARESDELPEEIRKEIAASLKEFSRKYRSISESLEPVVSNAGATIDLTDRIKILAARTGSNEVLASCRKLTQIINQWITAKSYKESRENLRYMKESINEILDEITNALRYGPFSA
jgi:hypothetical protein